VSTHLYEYHSACLCLFSTVRSYSIFNSAGAITSTVLEGSLWANWLPRSELEKNSNLLVCTPLGQTAYSLSHDYAWLYLLPFGLCKSAVKTTGRKVTQTKCLICEEHPRSLSYFGHLLVSWMPRNMHQGRIQNIGNEGVGTHGERGSESPCGGLKLAKFCN